MKLQMRPHETPGLLITFCGLDGCGKTTLIRRLTRYLEELEVPTFLTKQPTDAVRQSEIFRTYMDTPAHDAYDYRALSLVLRERPGTAFQPGDPPPPRAGGNRGQRPVFLFLPGQSESQGL